MIELRTKQNNLLIGYFDNEKQVQEYWSLSKLYDNNNSYIINISKNVHNNNGELTMNKKIKLNSAGSCWTNNENYFSYKQQITANYKGYTLFDSGFYSMTTRKHQGLIRHYISNPIIYLEYANFNNGIEWSIEHEIKCLEYNIEQLQSKRKTKKCLATIDEYTNKIIRLQELLNK